MKNKLKNKQISEAWKRLIFEMENFPEVIHHTKQVIKTAKKIAPKKISFELEIAIIFHDIGHKLDSSNHHSGTKLFFEKWQEEKKINQVSLRKIFRTLQGKDKEGKIFKSADAIANISDRANIPRLLFRSWQKMKISSFKEGIREARNKLAEKSTEIFFPTSKSFKKKLKKDLLFLEKNLKDVEGKGGDNERGQATV